MVLTLVLITIQMAVFAAGKSTVTDERTSKPYHYLHITGTLDVKIEQGSEFGITVKGSSQDQVYNTVTWRRNDTLFVYQTNINKYEPRTKVIIRVDNLAVLEVSGDVKVDCVGINSDILTVKASDRAKVRLDIRALKVESKATGSSHIDISGISVTSVEDVDGKGTIDSHLLDVIVDKKPLDPLCIGC